MRSNRQMLTQIRVMRCDPDRLEVVFHPVAYFVLGIALAVLCTGAGLRYLRQEPQLALLALGAGGLFFIGLCLVSYRRVSWTFDRAAGVITHARRIALVLDRVQVYPLARCTGAMLQTVDFGDRQLQRARLKFSDRKSVPILRAYIAGDSPGEVVDQIRDWLEAKGPDPAGPDPAGPETVRDLDKGAGAVSGAAR